MGEVYLAEDERLGRKVALKFLAPDLARDAQALQRFRNEARLSAGLSHSNIASIHGFEEIEGRWFHVHEYVEGQTLQERIRRGPLDLDEIRAIAIDLSRGLAHAHSRGVIHRDLKPANVIVTPEGTAKILDFGLARRSGSETQTLPGVTLGTVAYMSPEQIQGGVVDHRCDLWAFGALLYESLTGQQPFGAPEIPAQLNRILHEQPTPVNELRSKVPEDLRRVVELCLRKDRQERFATAEEVLAVLGLSVDLRHPLGPGARSRPALRVAWIGVATVLIALAAVGLSMLNRRGGTGPSMAQSVTVEDEFGELTTQSIPAANYRKRVAVFFADEFLGTEDSNWLAHGLPQLISIDLAQDAFVIAQTPFYFIELVRREGRPDGLGLSRALQRKIAREQMAAAFATYRIEEHDDGMLALTQTVHETESGRELASRTLEAEDLFELADRASVALRKDLRIPEVLAQEYPDLPVSEISTESPAAYRAYIDATLDVVMENDYRGAAQKLEVAAVEDSTFALAHLSSFVVRSVLQDMAGMRMSAERAMRYVYRMPQSLQFATKANYYLNIEQDPDKAFAVTRMWTQLHPGDEDAYRQLAMFHQLRNEPEERVSALEEVLRIDPADFNTLQAIGTIYREMGRYEDASRWLRRFVETYPSRAGGRIELARLYVDLAQRDRARQELERAVLLEDRSPEAHLALADIEAREGNLGEARRAHEQALRIAATAFERSQVHSEMEDLAVREGRIRDALMQVESARAAAAEALPPTQVTIQTLASARLFALIGEGDEGLAMARQERLALSPLVRGAAGIGLVPLFLELGEVDSARVHLERLQRFVQTYKLEVVRPLILSYEAEIAEYRGDLESALEHLNEVDLQHPSRVRTLRMRGRVLRQLGRWDEAEQTLQRARELDPHHPETQIEWARLLLARERPIQAREAIEDALDTWSGADAAYVRSNEARRLLRSLGGGR
jgi:tetratricopeptide (TPR) repeat protein